MSQELYQRLFGQLDAIPLIDPHTHIVPHSAAATNLADLLGYHYYTELAHSAGMPREQIEDPAISRHEKVRRLVENLQPIENTIQYSWLIELAQQFFEFQDERLTTQNWESLYETVEKKSAQPDWADQVLAGSGVEAVFLTNDFDDPLEGFNTEKYVPCLRTDDLVFHLARPQVQERLKKATDVEVTNLPSLREAVGKLFEHFKQHGARACAISLPPDFAPHQVEKRDAEEAVRAILHNEAPTIPHQQEVSSYIFWMLAEFCRDYQLPFDLMIGVNREVYQHGVHQGRDLFDSRVSLIQYRQLFNAFPEVTFPISVLASVTNHELVAYSWIFPNVVTSGHWWYSNTPTYIQHDLGGRIEAVPQTKQVGYYSDAYKLEFVQPKFAMYKRCMAHVLANKFVLQRGWSEEQAIELGRQLLRGNVEKIFRF